MVKLFSMFGLKDGVDPDEFWKFWSTTHVARITKAVGTDVLKKYVIDRVIWYPDDSGKKYCCGALLWFDGDVSTAVKALERMRGAGKEWQGYTQNVITTFTQEKEIDIMNLR